eukprot:TRINITY_DN5599_c0_g1_i2.p1 TRINITY_DN5599_c0_g1~~TRINITY_DN5599_c0_g1_i2.p1  ORF type:complete len:148 (-),score=39.21 TRINITY_DN5599_c0_g1_i2:161-604(-)
MGRGRDSRSRSRGGGGGDDEERLQKLVDERQQCRRDRDFSRADKLRDELRDMDVHIDDNALTWKGPKGMSGRVTNVGFGGGGGGGSGERREGDWDCPKCNALVFASKDNCFKCGHSKRDDRRSGGSRDRRRRDDSRRRDSSRDRRRR